MSNPSDQKLQRLQRLADGVYILAMVLMVLQFNLPDPNQSLNDGQLWHYLKQELPNIRIYLGSYILIVFYWLSHLDQFQHYEKTDGIHLWLTLLSLMFIVLLPFANDLSSQYPLSVPVQIFYSLVLFLVGLFSGLSWLYGSYQKRLISPDLRIEIIRAISWESCLEPFFCLLSIGVAIYNPIWWEYTFWGLIPAYLLLAMVDQSSHYKNT